MNIVLTVVIAILLFGLIIFLHELGHFLTARMFGVKVNEFALGMGPRILKFGKGETVYSLRAFPIGGFCAMEGEDDDSKDPRAFNNKKIWQRFIVVIAGATMNIILGFLLLIGLFVQEPAFKSTTIMSVGDAISISDSKELLENDKIVAINGYRIYTDMDFNSAMSKYATDEMTFTVNRNGEKIDINGVKIDTQKLTGKDNGYAFIVQSIDKNFFTLISQSAKSTVSIVRLVWSSLVDLVTGHYGIKDLSGPVGTAEVIGQAASAGSNFIESLNNILYIMSLITINLGVFNLLPFPALDGGRAVFLIVEAIRRKPINAKYESWINMAGLALLLGLMVVVTFSDIIKIFQR